MPKKNDKDSRKHRIFLVDDHPVLRKGLTGIIELEPDMIVCGEAEDIPAALAGIEQAKPDIAVVDLTLKDASGIELIKDLKIRHPELPTMALSMHDESFYAERVIRAGARGYIMKQEAPEHVIGAIRKVLAGEIFLSQRMSSRLLSKLAGKRDDKTALSTDVLSDRELEVFELIGQGLQTRQIAEKLHLSIKTVDTHRENIKKKLRLANATELLQHAIQWVQFERGA